MLSVITIMITVAFIFWGIGPNSKQPVEFVAEIEGNAITLEQYWRAYDSEYNRLKDQGTKPEDIEKINLKDRILSRIVNRRVLLFAADQAGISITENELQAEIINSPYFQKDGVFNRDVYERRLRINRITPSKYETSLRDDMVIAKMSRIISEAAELSAEELKIIESIQGGNKEQLSEIFRSSKSNQIITAYIESIKKEMNIKINKDLIL